eukprot:TRINITY_DN42065_c0_g1_i1.p1 TRINITY_DN42065_c0_g1~~TRINITY_DN42065_c0_g1_i1.p1  ORF type:complete len:673 (-),score=189.44 TRINITY_DN42065_c0_g1_i1:62-2008(-)
MAPKKRLAKRRARRPPPGEENSEQPPAAAASSSDFSAGAAGHASAAPLNPQHEEKEEEDTPGDEREVAAEGSSAASVGAAGSPPRDAGAAAEAVAASAEAAAASSSGVQVVAAPAAAPEEAVAAASGSSSLPIVSSNPVGQPRGLSQSALRAKRLWSGNRASKKRETMELQQRCRHRLRELRQRVDVSGAWVQKEDIEVWQRHARKALEKLATPLALEDGEEATLDISTANCRYKSTEEVIEAMMRARLLAEGHDPDEAVAASKEEALKLKAKKPPPQSCRVAGRGGETAKEQKARRSAKSSKALVVGGTALSAEELEKMAPIREYEDLEAERSSRARTETARVLLEKRRQKSRPGPHASSLEAFAVGQERSMFGIHVNVVQGNPHKRWLKRLKERYAGSIIAEAPELDHDCLPTSDLEGLPGTLPKVNEGDLVFTVQVCSSSAGAKEQEFDILGSQCLYELRDAFHFASDWMFEGPTRQKSACFFIDGVVYTDDRDPTALDYSREIIDWLKVSKGPGFVRCNKGVSMKTKILDLSKKMPFGARWTYIHQGDIEHNVFFTGLRLYNPLHDCIFRQAYPVLTYMKKYTKRTCYCCLRYPAIWIVLGSSRCPHNPAFFCATCFRQFYQDKDGNYVEPVDYKLFPYIHDDL